MDNESPKIIPREAHTISRRHISPFALKVLYRLHEAGFAAYLVGGSVRDLLLGHQPKDFDVATDARPEQVKQLFKNCLLIGRRFRLAHIRFGREIIEVATFRGDHRQASDAVSTNTAGLILRDNVYGTLEEDAWRRDFTINALYYNIADYSVIDFCGGLDDLTKGIVRIIGDPLQRYQEDPVRLLRAIRIAAKLHLQIEKETATPIYDLVYLLHQVAPARLFEETLKLLLKGAAAPTFQYLLQYKLFHQLFPATATCFEQTDRFPAMKFVQQAMHNSDMRLAQQKTVTPVFLLAVLLWYPLTLNIEQAQAEGMPLYQAIEHAMRITLKKQQQITTIPKRFSQGIIDIWRLQFRLQKRMKRSVQKILHHPRFRASYDLLLLRTEAGEALQDIAQWWTTFHTADDKTREAMQRKLTR